MDAIGVKRPTDDPHATAYVDADGGADRASSSTPGRPTRPATASTSSTEGVDGLRDAGPPVPRLPARRRPHRGQRREAVAARLRALEEGQAGRADVGLAVGAGRPGWHTECVVMSLELLGEGFDIHGGGQDLAFPHHENEWAQAKALGKDFARHWVHNGFVEVGGEKMSKSLGNFSNLHDMATSADPRAYRLLVLQAHYRSPVEVNHTTAEAASSALSRLDALARRMAGVAPQEPDADRAGPVPGVDGRRPGHARGGGPALRPGHRGQHRARRGRPGSGRPRRGRPCWRSAPRWASSSPAAPRCRRRSSTWPRCGTRHGRPRTGPRPTACGTRSGHSVYEVEDTPEGTRVHPI